MERTPSVLVNMLVSLRGKKGMNMRERERKRERGRERPL